MSDEGELRRDGSITRWTCAACARPRVATSLMGFGHVTLCADCVDGISRLARLLQQPARIRGRLPAPARNGAGSGAHSGGAG